MAGYPAVVETVPGRTGAAAWSPRTAEARPHEEPPAPVPTRPRSSSSRAIAGSTMRPVLLYRPRRASSGSGRGPGRRREPPNVRPTGRARRTSRVSSRSGRRSGGSAVGYREARRRTACRGRPRASRLRGGPPAFRTAPPAPLTEATGEKSDPCTVEAPRRPARTGPPPNTGRRGWSKLTARSSNHSAVARARTTATTAETCATETTHADPRPWPAVTRQDRALNDLDRRTEDGCGLRRGGRTAPDVTPRTGL